MKGKKPAERGVLMKAIRWEIHPTPEQIERLCSISRNLAQVWNSALDERMTAFELRRQTKEAMDQAIAKTRNENLSETLIENLAHEQEQLVEAVRIPTLFDQINGLTGKRANDPSFATVPRNWQEETLDRLNGSFASWSKLRQNGDVDARPPRKRGEHQFQVIPGRSGFAIRNGKVSLSCRAATTDQVALEWSIPEYQQRVLDQAKTADPERFKLKKFVLARDPHDLAKPGRWWVSVVYETARPLPKPESRDNTVYLALGASWVGVLWNGGEKVIPLWRPDAYWQPQIEAVKTRMKGRTKGSRGWQELQDAKRVMETKMSLQRKQHFYEVAHRLLKHGCHFVVTDYVVRSKPGKLADSEKRERGGTLGLNWSAQNTGSLAEFVLLLTQKAEEKGGSVRRVRVEASAPIEGHGRHNKLQIARLLREKHMSSR